MRSLEPGLRILDRRANIVGNFDGNKGADHEFSVIDHRPIGNYDSWPLKRRRANWFAWSMQAVFGLVAGAVAGLLVVSRGRAGLWLDSDRVIPFLIGTALIGAGLGSRYGDRLWVGDHYYMIPPDEPAQNNLSDYLSWCLVAAGAATCGVTILKETGLI